MKKKLSILLIFLLSLVMSACVKQGQNISFVNYEYFDSSQHSETVNAPSGLPENYSEFKNRCQTMLQTPAGAIKMYFDAVFVYADPKTRREGQKMLRYVMRSGENWDRAASYSTFVSRLKDPAKHYIFRSYAEGTSPENGYAMSVHNYSVEIARIVDESDYTRVNVVSTGADSSRIMWVKQFDDGLYYVINNAGSYVDVRPPKRTGRASNNSHDADYD